MQSAFPRQCISLDEDEAILIRHYRQLSDMARRKIVKLAELFIETPEPPPDNVIPFPTK